MQVLGSIKNVINHSQFNLGQEKFRAECKNTLDEYGVLVLENFLTPDAIASIQKEGEAQRHLAYYTERSHKIYLKNFDPEFTEQHPRDREVTSSKGCITTDQIPSNSALHTLYKSQEFQDFLCNVLEENELHAYADPLSSINLHYADAGQELGWHFDNSSFAITLMILPPESGGSFEYVKDVRDADAGEMNYEQSG